MQDGGSNRKSSFEGHDEYYVTQEGTIPETNITVPQAEFECRSLEGGSLLLSLASHVFSLLSVSSV